MSVKVQVPGQAKHAQDGSAGSSDRAASPGTAALPGANGKIGLPVSTKRRTYQISATIAKIIASDANARMRRG